MSIRIEPKLPDNTVIVCIGSANAFLDSLAPRVGSKLQALRCPFTIYGTMDDPVNGENCEFKIPEIKSKHPDSFIIGIDSCLCGKENLGKIGMDNHPIRPGSGADKNLPPIGNMRILGATALSLDDILLVKSDNGLLQNMVDEIVEIIMENIRRYE